MNLTINTDKTGLQRKIEIELPAFYKKRLHGDSVIVVGILDETLVNIYHSKNMTSIRNEATEGNESEIAGIHAKYDLCTEEEFFETFNQAYKSLQLNPVKQYYANGMTNATI